MELRDWHIWLALFVLLCVIVVTLISIFSFMPVVEKCQPAFTVINHCGCVPDDNLAKLFNVKESLLPQNVTTSIQVNNGD